MSVESIKYEHYEIMQWTVYKHYTLSAVCNVTVYTVYTSVRYCALLLSMYKAEKCSLVILQDLVIPIS